MTRQRASSSDDRPERQKSLYYISPPPKAVLKPLVLRKLNSVYSVDSLLKQAHAGHELGKATAYLFDKFDVNKDGQVDVEELTLLVRKMLETTLKTLVDANEQAMSADLLQRPQDEITIRQEARAELDMMVTYGQMQIARADEIAVSMKAALDENGDGVINKKEFMHEITECLRCYADFHIV